MVDRISDESIKGHERGQRWKKSKKQIERDPGCNQHDAVLVNLRPDPPPDILPGNSSEFRWPVRAAAPISLLQQSLSQLFTLSFNTPVGIGFMRAPKFSNAEEHVRRQTVLMVEGGSKS